MKYSIIEKIEVRTGKKMLTIADVANYIGISLEDAEELIRSSISNVITLGNKQYILSKDLGKFLYEGLESGMENNCEKTIDFGLQNRYPSPLLFENLSEEDYEDMARRGKGEGSVFFNESRKVWQAAISMGKDENGKRLRKIISGKERQEVLEELVKFMSNPATVPDQQVVIPPVITKAKEISFKKFLDECLKNIQGRPRTRTFANYIGTAKLVERGLGRILMSELTKDDIQRFLNEFSSKKYTKGCTVDYYSQSAIHKVYLLLNTIIREAVDKELISKPFVLKEPKSKKHVEQKYKALQDNEIKAILEAVEDHPMLKTVVMIMIYTGMRPGEVFALRFQDVDYENRTISVEQALSLDWEDPDIETKSYTKSRTPIIKNLKNDDGGKSAFACRTLTVSEKALNTIKEWQKHLEKMPALMKKRKENGMQDMLFTGIHGQLALPEYYHQVYERQLAKKELSSKVYKFYRFRHSFCTRNLKAKKDPKVVMRLMGDNTLEMVLQVYNSINKDDIIKASDEYSTEMDTTLETLI